MSLTPKKKTSNAKTSKSAKSTQKQVHKSCGKSDIVLSDKYKKINPAYVGVCKTCNFPITKAEIVSLADYRYSKKSETHIDVDGEWVNLNEE